MKSIYKSVLLLVGCAVLAGAADYSFPSSAIPGGKKPAEVDQIITLSWDASQYSGLEKTQYETAPSQMFIDVSWVGGKKPWGASAKNELNILPGQIGMSWVITQLAGRSMPMAEYDATVDYPTGIQVVYQEKIWESKYYVTKGTTPGEDASNPFKLIGPYTESFTKKNPDGTPFRFTFNAMSGVFVPVVGANYGSRVSKYGYWVPNTTDKTEFNLETSVQKIAASWGREMMIKDSASAIGNINGEAYGQINDVFKVASKWGHEVGNHTIDRMDLDSPLPNDTKGFGKWESEGFSNNMVETVTWGSNVVGFTEKTIDESINDGRTPGISFHSMGWKPYAGRYLSTKAWKGVLEIGEEPLTDNFGWKARRNSGFIDGFKAPRGEVNSNLYFALSELGYLYDASLKEGLEGSKDGTNYVWPYTMDNGAPNTFTLRKKGGLDDVAIDSLPVGTGLWQYPVNPIIVHPDDRSAVFAAYKAIQAAKGIDVSGEQTAWLQNGKIPGDDYDMFILWGMNKEQAERALTNTLDKRLAGNKSPLHITLHSDLYTPIYDNLTLRAPRNVATLGQALKYNTWTDRKGVIENFVTYAQTKGVFFKSAKETIEYTKSLLNASTVGSKATNITPAKWGLDSDGTATGVDTVTNLSAASITLKEGNDSWGGYKASLNGASLSNPSHIKLTYTTTAPLYLMIHYSDGNHREVLLNNLGKKDVESGLIPFSAFEDRATGISTQLDLSKISAVGVYPQKVNSNALAANFSISNIIIYNDTSGIADTTKPVVSISSPTTSTSATVGSPITIQWVAKDNDSVSYIKLERSNNGGQQWSAIITNTANDSSESWTPTVAGTYKIRVTAYDMNGNPQSAESQNFTVQSKVTASAVGNGTISPSGTITVLLGNSSIYDFKPNDTLTRLDSVKVDGTIVTVTGTSYTIPAISTNRTIVAYFGPKPKYKATVVSGDGSGDFIEGAKVLIAATTPSGKVFVQWSTTSGVTFADANSASTSFSMPSKAVTVTPLFKDASAPTYALTVEGGSGSGNYEATKEIAITATVPVGKQFVRWESLDGVVFANANNPQTTVTMPAKIATVKAVFGDAPKYKVSITGGSGEGDYAEGATVQIVASAPAGKVFVQWLSQDGVTFVDAKNQATTFAMPAKAVVITAEYKDAATPTYALTVEGGTGSGNYEADATVSIIAAVPSGKRFVRWESADGVTFGNAGSSETTIAMPTKMAKVTAVFETITIVTYAVTVEGGSGSGSYEAGKQVTIAAEVPAGKVFVQWNSLDDINLLDSKSKMTSFVMPQNAVTVTAEFADAIKPTFALTVKGGKGSGNYVADETVSFTADVIAGKKFLFWESADGVLFANANNSYTTIVMPSKAVTVSAIFEDSTVTTPIEHFVVSGASLAASFNKVSDYWHKSATNQTGFVELAPDSGEFETPDVRADGKFDYKDLNRFVQYCYWYDAKSSGGSIIRGSRSQEELPVTVSAVRTNGVVQIVLNASSAVDITALACRLATNDEAATWREGSFISQDAQSLSMRGKTGLTVARLSETSRAVSGSGVLATAELITGDSEIAVEVVLVDAKGNERSGIVYATVVEDRATGVTLVLSPNPFMAGEPIRMTVQSETDPVVSVEMMIYDPVGNRLFKESKSGSSEQVTIEWSGTDGSIGSFCAIAKYRTESGKSGVLTGMIGHKR